MDHVRGIRLLALGSLLLGGCSMLNIFSGEEPMEDQLQKCRLANVAPAPGARDVAMEKLLTAKAQALIDKKFDAGEFKVSYLYATDANWAAKRGYKVFRNGKGEVIGQGDAIVVNGRTINATATGKSKRGTCAAISFTINQGWDGTNWGEYELAWTEKMDPASGTVRIPCRNK